VHERGRRVTYPKSATQCWIRSAHLVKWSNPKSRATTPKRRKTREKLVCDADIWNRSVYAAALVILPECLVLTELDYEQVSVDLECACTGGSSSTRGNRVKAAAHRRSNAKRNSLERVQVTNTSNSQTDGMPETVQVP
jgi:hypothetical protein